MKRFFQSSLAAVLLGGLLYLGVTTALVLRVPLVSASPPKAPASYKVSGPAWDFVNPELDRLVAELREQKAALQKREEQLNELAARLEAERAELNIITQAVYRVRDEFDKKLVQVREEEVANLKRLAKMYASMSPEGAANILKQMEDEQALKFMVFMRDAEAGPILEALARLSEADAKRAAALSDRLRTTTYRNALPKTQ
jgi:flagellar motility protein MotE (MotC chaperone)